jgi:hypothetical protein
MRTRKFLTAAAAIALLAASSSGFASPVTVLSYDMANGSTGSYNYWDDTYSGSGSKTTDFAALSGGKGDLTDGIKATDNWNVTEAPTGPGPYVGWSNFNPVIRFHFGAPVTINGISFNFDDANGFGGVSTPLSVTVGGTTYAVADPVGSAPFQFDLTGLGLTVSDLDITLNRRTNWVFVSEISFDDGRSGGVVPEPGALALLGLGLAGLAFSRRKNC